MGTRKEEIEKRARDILEAENKADGAEDLAAARAVLEAGGYRKGASGLYMHEGEADGDGAFVVSWIRLAEDPNDCATLGLASPGRLAASAMTVKPMQSESDYRDAVLARCPKRAEIRQDVEIGLLFGWKIISDARRRESAEKRWNGAMEKAKKELEEKENG